MTPHRKTPGLDTRWLTVHPVTALWWQQRQQCRQCRHYVPAVASVNTKHGDRTTSERCRASTTYRFGGRDEHKIGGYRIHLDTCIDARATADQRDDGRPGPCGPDATLFQPKE